MSITINISPELEERLRKAAIIQGADVGDLIVQIIERQLQEEKEDRESRELALLQKINQGVSPREWERYYQLMKKRDAEELLPAEYQELLKINDKIEIANARRMAYLIELASLREVSLDDLMQQLGIKPAAYGN